MGKLKFVFKKVFVLALGLLSILSLSSFAKRVDEKIPLKENNGLQIGEIIENNDELEGIYSDFSKLLPDGFLGELEELSGISGIGELIGYIKSAFLGSGSSFPGVLLTFLALALFFALAEILTADSGDIAPTVKSALSVCLSLPVLSFAKDVVSEVEVGISAGSEFFTGLIPIVSSVLAMSGAGGTAAASAAGMSLTLSFVSGFLAKNLLPAATLIFSISLITSFDTAGGLSSAAKGIRGWFNFGIGLCSLVLVAILTFQSVLTASADSVALRGVKYAASNMIPIVGSVVSSSLATLFSGLKLLSSVIGAGSVALILSAMGAPLLSLLLYRFSIGAAITVCSLSGAAFGQKFFESVRGALDCVIGILASSLVIYSLEIIIFTRVIGGLL